MFTVVLGSFVNNLLRTKVFCRLGVSLTTVVVVNDSAGRLVGLVRLRVGRLVGFFVVLRLVVGGLLVVILGRVVILRIGRLVVVGPTHTHTLGPPRPLLPVSPLLSCWPRHPRPIQRLPS